MKTKVLQGSLAYLPEDVVRHGQLAGRVDVFSCGVVCCLLLVFSFFGAFGQQHG